LSLPLNEILKERGGNQRGWRERISRPNECKEERTFGAETPQNTLRQSPHRTARGTNPHFARADTRSCNGNDRENTDESNNNKLKERGRFVRKTDGYGSRKRDRDCVFVCAYKHACVCVYVYV